MEFRLIGPGRAGSSIRLALEACGWRCAGSLGRADDPTAAARGVDAVILAVPDRAIAEVAQAIESTDAAVIHLSGATTLAALAPHDRRASVHPLVSLPDAETGAARLRAGATFAVAGDPVASTVVETLGGTAIEVPDRHRATYHAAACVASNHLVALSAQVERLAAAAEVPTTAYLGLMAQALDNVRASGATKALTGPVARGDLETVRSHLAAIDPAEHGLYLALADAAATLAGQPLPSADRDG